MTLLELMAVVTIIGIFVALSVPAMGGIMRDRHAARAADELANVFRIGRARASATGAAHYIKVAASGTSSTIELRSALTGVGGPVASCSATTWGAADSRQLKLISLNAGTFAEKDIKLNPADAVGGAAVTPDTTEFCYTPGGSAWVRPGTLWIRPPATAVARWKVHRPGYGLTRIVRVTPSGLPAIEAE